MTFLKTAATALVLTLATATAAAANAPTHLARTHLATTHKVAGKGTAGRIAVGKHHHVRVAHGDARRGAVARRASGTKVVATPGLRHVAENHRPSARTSVVR